MSEPKIIDIVTPSFYSGDSDLFGSSYLRDGDIVSSGISTGAASDATTVTGTYGDNITYVDFTTVVILNTNKLFNGLSSSYNLKADGVTISGVTVSEHTTIDGFRHACLKFPKTSAKLFEMSWSSTTPANQEKRIGELILANENTVTLARDFNSYQEKWREKVKEIMLGDGGVHRVITLSGSGKNLRYEANCQFKFMTTAEVEALRALKESGNPFWFMPESETNPHKIFQCHWTGPWDVTYTSSYKGAGLTVNMQVKEIR